MHVARTTARDRRAAFILDRGWSRMAASTQREAVDSMELAHSTAAALRR